MQINRPDQGLFKGMNKQADKYTHKKNFAKLDNQHQFNLEHPKQGKIQTMSNFMFKQYPYTKYEKRIINSNKSNIVFGTDSSSPKIFTQNRNQNLPKLQKMNQKKRTSQPIILGIDRVTYLSQAKNQYQCKDLERQNNINYKVLYNKTDPILCRVKSKDEYKNISGYQFFNPQKNRKYVANNFTLIPKINQHYDIITGKKFNF